LHVAAIERALEPFDARSHWGKLFTMSPARVQSLFERMFDFRGLLESRDPKGNFRNAFVDDYLFGR
jgi:alditol oxidase